VQINATLPSIAKKYGIFLSFAVTVVVLSIVADAFLTPRNLLNILRQTSVIGTMAIGMTFVILIAGIDLSVGSTLALTGVLCAGFIKAGIPVPLSVLMTLAAGAAIGLANGLLITWGKVTPFVVTLGTMSIARGAAHVYTNGQPISGFEPGFRFIGAGEVLGAPMPVLLFLATTVLAAIVLKQTLIGRHIYAIGGNAEAAHLSGVNVARYTSIAYALCGFTAALGAVILTARLNAAESIAGMGYELDVIAAVVIGGTSLMGGRGGVWGTLVGALLIGTIDNGMDLLMISSYYQLIVKGTIIVLAVLLDRYRK
jgi:ribose/xylose/arabinose/galactoside ABC-type transport system permease subunit